MFSGDIRQHADPRLLRFILFLIAQIIIAEHTVFHHIAAEMNTVLVAYKILERLVSVHGAFLVYRQDTDEIDIMKRSFVEQRLHKSLHPMA